MDCPYPTIKIRKILILTHLKENANELDDEMSEIEPLKAGEMIESIVFNPKRKIRLSRSTHKVNSYIDFRPYQSSFKKFETYLHRFSRDLWDPDYIGALVNMNRFKEEKYEYILKRKKSYFGPTTIYADNVWNKQA